MNNEPSVTAAFFESLREFAELIASTPPGQVRTVHKCQCGNEIVVHFLSGTHVQTRCVQCSCGSVERVTYQP